LQNAYLQGEMALIGRSYVAIELNVHLAVVWSAPKTPSSESASWRRATLSAVER